MKKMICFLSICSTLLSTLFSEESIQVPSSLDLPQNTHQPAQIQQAANEQAPSIHRDRTKKFITASSLFIIPGIGVSWRGENFTFDTSVHTIIVANSISASASYISYFGENPKRRPYVSVGAGIASLNLADEFSLRNTCPIFPLRVGIEYKKFFFDANIIGVANPFGYDKMKIAIPELRFGFGY